MTFDDEPVRDALDQILREALQKWENLRDLMTLFGPEWVNGFDFARMTVLPREHVQGDWRSRESDLLIEIPYRTGSEVVPALVCLLLEHQSRGDPRMPLRILSYGVQYWDRKWRAWQESKKPRPKFDLPPLLPVVFHTGPIPWGSNRTIADLLGEPKAFHAFCPKWEPLFWELSSHSPESLCDSAAALAQFLAILRLDGAERAVLEPIYRRALMNLQRITGLSEVRVSDMLNLVIRFASYRRPKEERKEWLEMGERILESQARVQQWIERKETIADSYREEGRVEGALQTARAYLLMAGTAKLGPPSPEVASELNQIMELDRLTSLFQRIAGVGSWEALLNQ